MSTYIENLELKSDRTFLSFIIKGPRGDIPIRYRITRIGSGAFDADHIAKELAIAGYYASRTTLNGIQAEDDRTRFVPTAGGIEVYSKSIDILVARD
jgi:hypothetical protein